MESAYDLPKNKKIMMYFRFAARIVMMLLSVMGLLSAVTYLSYTKNMLMYVVVLALAVFGFVAIAYNLFNRNYYLPFLGWSVYPCGSLAEKVPNKADTEVKIQTAPNSNVIYWASEPSDVAKQPISNPWDAYANYDNAGVVRSDANGNATLKFRMPSAYNVGLMNRTLKPHVHYRVCKHPGMLSDIKTKML